MVNERFAPIWIDVSQEINQESVNCTLDWRTSGWSNQDATVSGSLPWPPRMENTECAVLCRLRHKQSPSPVTPDQPHVGWVAAVSDGSGVILGAIRDTRRSVASRQTLVLIDNYARGCFLDANWRIRRRTLPAYCVRLLPEHWHSERRRRHTHRSQARG